MITEAECSTSANDSKSDSESHLQSEADSRLSPRHDLNLISDHNECVKI